MRYGLYLADLRPSATDSRGTINYAVGLASAVAALLGPADDLFILTNHELWAEAAALGATKRLGHVDFAPSRGAMSTRLALDHVGSVRWARRRRLDVVHFPKGHIPLWTPRSVRTVATIHDDIAVRYARGQFGGEPSLKNLYFARAVMRGVRCADQILTVSRFSAQSLARLGRVDTSRLTVTYEAPTLPRAEYVPIAERDRTLLILGSRFPHKRTLQSIEWGHRYRESTGGNVRVVVLGELTADVERICEDLQVTRVRSGLSGHDLAALMAGARALIFGSAYEGFGLPPVEAFCAGTPAVYQRTGAMAEVLNDFPGGYATSAYPAFAAALEGVLALDDVRLRQLQATMIRRYRWEDVAASTLGAYRRAAAPRRPSVRRWRAPSRWSRRSR